MKTRRPVSQTTPRTAGLARIGLALFGGGVFAMLAWNPRSPPVGDSAGKSNEAHFPRETPLPRNEIDHAVHRMATVQQAMTSETTNESSAVLNLRQSDGAPRFEPKQTVPEATHSFELTATHDAVTTPTANSRGPPQ